MIQVLRHPLLSARLQLCRPSLYLPVWWESGKHDRDLLVGAARHGLTRTDFYILNDPQLGFLDAHRNYVRGHPAHLGPHLGGLGHPGLPPPHCCLYEAGQPPEYPGHQGHQGIPGHQGHPPPPPPPQASAPSPSSSSSSSSHPHLPPPALEAQQDSPGLGLAPPGPRGVDFLDCPPLDDGLELAALQHDVLSGGKASKDALNGFPFNSAAAGQSMLNPYGAVGGNDLDSVLVGETGSAEETGLMEPSVELDRLQAPWDGADHTSPAEHMFNESDPILGPPGLEPGFLEEEDEETPGDRAGLEECLGLPPASPPSHPSSGDSVEPLSSSYMLFKDIGVNEEASADHTDLSASPPLPYVPPPLSMSDITGHVSQSLTNQEEEEAEPREGSAGFQFDDKEDEEEFPGGNMERSVDGEDQPRGVCGGLGVLDPAEVPQMEDGGVRAPRDRKEVLKPASPELQDGFEPPDPGEDVDPYLGKLEAPMDPMEDPVEEPMDPMEDPVEEPMDPPEEVAGLMLYQDQNLDGSLDSEAFLGNGSGEFVQVKAVQQNSVGGEPDADPADQVEEISEGPEFPSGSDTRGKTGPPTFPFDPESKDLLDGDEEKVPERKPEPGLVSVKVEDVSPDSSEVKPSPSRPVKSEELEPKPEQLEFPVRAQSPEPKPEDLRLPVKPEDLDAKPNVLPFADVKPEPEVKASSALQLTSYPDGGHFKVEAKPEVLALAAFADAVKSEAKTELAFYPDSSQVKAEPEGLDFGTLSRVKAELKQETLEADSTVLTPKLEQDGAGDAAASSEGLAAKGLVKEERPSTPGPAVDGYDRFPPPGSMCEVADGLHDAREPTIAQLLQEKALYSFSEWPKLQLRLPPRRHQDLIFQPQVQDRVVINRLDSICQAVLKGKWPSSSEQYDSPGAAASVAAGSCLAQQQQQQRYPGPAPARLQQPGPGLGFSIPPPLTRLPKYVPRGGACGRGAWRLTSLPLLQERLVAPPFLPELKRAGGRRAFDYEAAAAAAAAAKASAGKSASSSSSSAGGEKAAVVAPPPHRPGPVLLNGWQESAIDLTKASGEISTTSGAAAANEAGGGQKLAPLPPITAPLPGAGGMDISGILQAGLIHPVTGQIVNGSLRADDSLRRRRGRRRNVEALYSEFTKTRGLHLPETQGRVEVISHSSVSSSTSSPSPSPSDRPAGPPSSSSSSTPTPTQTPPQPEIVAIDREAASKGLMEWLRQNPGYSMDLPAFAHSGAGLLHGFVERPKQRRHRCKDPTKLDINSLTGEERVPVVHRGTGRRLGGAMAPAIKELSRWLDANAEYYVAPDWADVVKHSGFLPEGKFSRILTEPVNKDPGSRRRGRRPRSEMPKPVLGDGSPGLGPPFYMNGGLIGSMDSMVMQNLRGAVPGIPISGIMAAGFPHGFPSAGGASADDGKNGLSMLPMMLHGIPHPQHALFSVGTMMAHAPPPHPGSAPSSSSTKVSTTTGEASSPSSTTPADGESVTEEEKGGAEEEPGANGANAAVVVTSTSRAHPSGSAHLGAGSHLTFNPFLIPGVSHGLLYPHMFLPHGGIMALPAMPPAAAADNGSPPSPKRRRKRAREDAEPEEEKKKGAAPPGGGDAPEDEDERESTVSALGSAPSSSLVTPSTSAPPPATPPAAPEPDSNDHGEEGAEPAELGAEPQRRDA
ncbi:chromodomain-helicase-DNA-binding protein 7-like [Cololabis saira]|uniref:chromodomain-helicase-DNA-binding protein 7-like n=1 Tax=Cololabis saira TaxID=129043 RepID=UPI002AD31AFA|nr:chromodomain-helicase-DNA-binding protein 7-like [Cololabis saira]